MYNLAMMKNKVQSCGKCGKNKSLCNCGRPLFDGKNGKVVLSKLEYAFAHFLTDKEACVYAGISTSAYYRFIDERPEFRERKEQLRLVVSLGLRKVVLEHAKTDPQMALKLLERLNPSQFGTAAHRDPYYQEPAVAKPLSERTIELLKKYNPGYAGPTPRPTW